MYTQKFGTPDCMAGGAAKFFSGGKIEKMDINKIDDPIYLINCGPSWEIEIENGITLDFGISTDKPIYTIDTVEEIEEVEVGVAVTEEDKYLNIKNR